MLRVLVVMVIAVAALWYFSRDAASTVKIAEDQREDLQSARESVEMIEQASAAAASQSDDIRDQAMGVIGAAEDSAERHTE